MKRTKKNQSKTSMNSIYQIISYFKGENTEFRSGWDKSATFSFPREQESAFLWVKEVKRFSSYHVR